MHYEVLIEVVYAQKREEKRRERGREKWRVDFYFRLRNTGYTPAVVSPSAFCRLLLLLLVFACVQSVDECDAI